MSKLSTATLSKRPNVFRSSRFLTKLSRETFSDSHAVAACVMWIRRSAESLPCLMRLRTIDDFDLLIFNDGIRISDL